MDKYFSSRKLIYNTDYDPERLVCLLCKEWWDNHPNQIENKEGNFAKHQREEKRLRILFRKEHNNLTQYSSTWRGINGIWSTNIPSHLKRFHAIDTQVECTHEFVCKKCKKKI